MFLRPAPQVNVVVHAAPCAPRAGFLAHTWVMRGITARTVSSAAEPPHLDEGAVQLLRRDQSRVDERRPGLGDRQFQQPLVLAPRQDRLVEGDLRRREAGGEDHLKQAAAEGVVHPAVRAQAAPEVGEGAQGRRRLAARRWSGRRPRTRGCRSA